MEGLLIYFYLLDRRILFKSSVFLYHIQHFFRLVQSVYPLAYKGYRDFWNLQLSKILPYTTAFSTPLSTSIHWGTRCWRDVHDLQLINKATTYNTFEQPLKTTILWRARLTAVFLVCNCQRFTQLSTLYDRLLRDDKKISHYRKKRTNWNSVRVFCNNLYWT